MKSALLVIDVQRALCEGEQASHAAQQTVARISQAADAARAAGPPMVYVQHETPSSVFARGSYTWQLAQVLTPQAGDHFIDKTTPASIHNAWASKSVTTLTHNGPFASPPFKRISPSTSSGE